MKLESLPDLDSERCHLIRIYDFKKTEAQQLQSVIANLALGLIDSCHLQDLDFLTALNGIQLTLNVSREYHGLQTMNGTNCYCLSLMLSEWSTVTELITPFTQDTSLGFQWLNKRDIPLLLSVDGTW